MVVDIVIKFGGSAVTNKDILESLKADAIQHACSLVKLFVDQGKKIILVHGAGSFGHHQAKKYKVNDGFAGLTGDEEQTVKYGMCVTRVSVTKLNNVLVGNLCENGVNAVGLSTFGSWSTDNREVVQHNTDVIKTVMDNGCVPVLHGDCVFDKTKGCVILSGDTIIKTLCGFFEVQKVLFLTDVSGIYDKAPSNNGAILLRNITVDLEGNFSTDIEAKVKSDCDVTGGIKIKLETAKDIILTSEGNTIVFICNVLSSFSDLKLLNDSDFPGTVIKLKM